jgi:hypothetical protein
MKGKSLAIFLDSFNEIMPQGQQGMMQQFQRPVNLPINTGLEKLLGHYGMNIEKSIVLDESSFKQRVPRAYGGGERQIYFAPIIKNENINKDVAFLQNIKGLASMALAYAVDGPFPSYFADKPVPEKKEEKSEEETADSRPEVETKQEGIDMSAVATEGATIRKGKRGRIFIIGTSEILQDNVIDEE